MKKYLDNRTGEKFTMAELRQAFADAEIKNQTFEDWFDEEIRKGNNGEDGLEEIEVNWFLVDEKGADVFTENLEVDTLERAVVEAHAMWECLSDYDKKQRNAFYVAIADEDEDGDIDWESIGMTMDVRDLDDTVLEAAKIIAVAGFEEAVSLMDAEICENLANEITPCSDLEFLTAYMVEHEQKFGEEFTV